MYQSKIRIIVGDGNSVEIGIFKRGKGGICRTYTTLSNTGHDRALIFSEISLPGCAAPLYVSLRSGGFVAKQLSLRYPGKDLVSCWAKQK